jgi:hypothetical protein
MILRIVPFLVVALAVLSGCKDGGEEPVPVTPVNTNEVAPPTVQGLPAQKLTVQSGADTQTILNELGRELRRWVRRNQRLPASFEEFVASAQLQPPPPPQGKKYAIGPQMTVVLQNR